MSQILTQTDFDEHFTLIQELLPSARYQQLKEHILVTNETLNNLNAWMRDAMEIDQQIRYLVLDLVENYDGFSGDF